MKPVLLTVILATVTMSAVAQIALKIGVSAMRASASIGHGVTGLVQAALTSPFLWGGLAIYGGSVIAWLWVLSQIDVSVAYPFVGTSFILTAVMGAVFLHENVTPLRIAGTLLIVLGCVLVARSA